MNDANKNPNKDELPCHYSSEAVCTVLGSLSAHIAIKDDKGKIFDTSRAWREYATKSGMPAGYDSIGDNYPVETRREICGYLLQSLVLSQGYPNLGTDP